MEAGFATLILRLNQSDGLSLDVVEDRDDDLPAGCDNQSNRYPDKRRFARTWCSIAQRSIRFCQYGDSEFGQNYVTFRTEGRFAFGVMYPTAINIVTGLPSS